MSYENKDQRIPKDILDQFERVEPIFSSTDTPMNQLVQTALSLLEQARSDLHSCCRHPLCSRLIEESVQYLYLQNDYQQIINTLRDLSPHVCRLVMHPFGSHVVQTLLSMCSKLARQQPQFNDIYESVLKQLLQEDVLAAMMEENCSTQVLKALIRLENGQVPETRGAKRQHSFFQIMCEDLYGPKCEFRNKRSQICGLLMKKIYKQMQKIGLDKILKLDDTASLLSVYCQNATEMEPDYSCLKVVCQIFKLDFDKELMKSEQFKATRKTSCEECACYVEALKKANLMAWLKTKPFGFFFETVVQLECLQPLAVAFLVLLEQEMHFEKIVASPLQFVYQKSLLNIYFCQEQLALELNQIKERFDCIFELDTQQVIANVLVSARKFQARCFALQNPISAEDKELFKNLLVDFFQTLVRSTNSEQFFARRLILPQFDDAQQLELDYQFKQNPRFDFRYLDKQVDKEEVDGEEFKKLMALKQQDHAKLQKLQRELKFGPGARMKSQNGIWQVGLQILLQYLQFTNIVYLKPLLLSFYTSFLDTDVKPTAQVQQDLIQLINHPGGHDLLLAFVSNGYIPVHYKFLMFNLLKSKLDSLCNFRFGRNLVLQLMIQFKSRVQMAVPSLQIAATSYEVNLSCMQVAADELANAKRVKSLQRSPEGQAILKELAMNVFMENKQIWIRDKKQHLEALEKRTVKKLQGAQDVE